MSVPSPAELPHVDAAGVVVTPMEGRGDLKAFVRFPWRVYQDDPAWVPPLVIDRKEFLTKHPFLKHGAAQAFLARRNDEVVGRILASDDPRFNEAHDLNTGAFGMFECIDDASVAGALLDAAADWCRARGRDRIWGPVDYSTNNQVGLLVDGFDTPPRLMMNHNPPYYARLLEAWGLTQAKDLFAWWVTDEHEPPERWRNLAEKLARRAGVRIRPVDFGAGFPQEMEKIKFIYNEAWEKNWGFVKMTDAEFEHLASELKLIIDPELALMAEIDGKPVGFSLSVPDLNEVLRHLPSGKLTTFGLPIGLGKLLWYRKRIHTLRLIILGVLEGYRRRGISELLILRTYDRGRERGYSAAEMGWTLADNVLINRAIEAVGGSRYKTYRVYERTLA